MKWVTLIATHARMRRLSLSAAPRCFQGLTCTSKTLNVGLLHTFLIKDPNWIFMFAENAFTKSVGSRAKQEEKDLCFSLSRSTESGSGGVANKILAALASRSPGACLCSLESFSLFSLVPWTPVPVLVGPGRGGGGGELGEALGKKERRGTDSLAPLPRKESECLLWAEGNLPRFLGVLELAGNQSPGWQN